ncbi:MAG: NFACT RNA binding domain-containing protein [Caldilineaceae bacterium]
MHFDALTMACMAAELQATVGNGRVQQLLAPDAQSIGMELYANRQRHYLLISTNAQSSRIQIVEQKLRRGVENASPLLLLLRKYVRDAALVEVTQPDPTERVLRLTFAHAEHGATQLLVEIMGQRSNVLLLNPQYKIMECLRRVWPGERVQRELLPGRPYTPPPPQTKLASTDDGSADYYTLLGAVTQAAGPLWKALVDQVAGVSPSLAREVAWRATGAGDASAHAADALALAQALQELWAPVQTGEWQPGIWQSDGQVIGFSPYIAHFRGEFVPVATLSQALTAFYAQREQATEGTTGESTPATSASAATLDAYAGLRATISGELRRVHARINRQLAALATDEPALGEPEQLRTKAEWLLALSSQIQPEQQTLAVDLDDRTLTIALDPNQTPVAQAEQMFKRAAKLERAAQFIPTRRTQLQSDLAFVEQLAEDLNQATNQPELNAIRAELQAAGLITSLPSKAKAGAQPSAQPLRFHTPQGFEIVVGRNARQNERVTFDLAKGEDLWLHARGAPGSHVVIRNGGQQVQAETLQMAAQLAAYYSKLRGERAVTVIVTPRRFVTRAPGGRTGQVLVQQEQTITVPGELPAAVADEL